jgi:RNA recognition motif-containing protein
MGSPDEAEAAVKAMDGKEIDGRAVRVSIARPKEDRPAGGGGGFRGGGGGYKGGGGGGGGRGGGRGDFGGGGGGEGY